MEENQALSVVESGPFQGCRDAAILEIPAKLTRYFR